MQQTAPTPAPASCAGVPNWIGDNYCDDNNNNAACQFDGGDCCNNSKPGWNNYCSVSKKIVHLKATFFLIYLYQSQWQSVIHRYLMEQFLLVFGQKSGSSGLVHSLVLYKL